jgi:membrane-associated phospholipid phosphatase
MFSHRFTTTKKFTVFLFSIAVLLLVILAVVVKKGNDVLWINAHRTDFLDLFFIITTNLGDGLIFVPVIIAFLFIRFELSILATAITLTHGIFVSLLKQVLFHGYPRPTGFLDPSLLHPVPRVELYTMNSFPSGHTTTAFGLALLLGLLVERKRASVALLLLALLVGYSRIYLLEHFLIDVAGGAVLGSVVTVAFWFSFNRFSPPHWMTRRLALDPKQGLKVTSGWPG